MLSNLTVRFASVTHSNMKQSGDLAQSEQLLTDFEIRQLFSLSVCILQCPLNIFPLSLRQKELLHERGVDINYETVRALRNRFGPMFAHERWRNSGAQSLQ